MVGHHGEMHGAVSVLSNEYVARTRQGHCVQVLLSILKWLDKRGEVVFELICLMSRPPPYER